MKKEKIEMHQHTIGMIASTAVFVIGAAYAIVTLLGFLSLESPQDPIGNSYFTIMELLILLLAPLMVISMISVHLSIDPKVKIYSLTALVFMILMAGITSCVHFTILTISHQFENSLVWVQSVFSFKWPSVVYALDILAWDLFFALAMLFSVPVFKGDGLEKAIRYLLLISGILSLAGLFGVILDDMDIRNIGIVGYGVFAPVSFLLLAFYFNRIPDRKT